MRKVCLISILITLMTCLYSVSALAGGLWLYEMATPDMGTASAGRAALASDASTVFSNPAGMTRLEGSQIFGGLQVVIPNVKFDVQEGTNVSGGGGGNAGVTLPGASGFYVQSLSKDWKLGIALNSYAGGVLDYGNTWAGRYYAEKSILITMNVNPAVAYRVTDWLSIGGGLDVMYGFLKGTAAVNNALDDPFLGNFPVGQITVSADAVGVGGNAGILLEPLKGTRIGLTYRSPIDLNFKDVPEITGLGPTLSAALGITGLANKQLDIGITVPQEFMVSIYQDITDRLAVMANFGWQDWSQFGKVDVNVSTPTGTTLTTKLEFKDTYHYSIGARYRIKDPWTLMAGFAYDTSAMDESSRSPSFPLDRQFRYAVGFRYDWSDRFSIGGAYEFMDAGEAPINKTRGPLSGTLIGDYSSDYYNFLAFYVSYKF
jgi:long-chain fatty acid transport protein